MTRLIRTSKRRDAPGKVGKKGKLPKNHTWRQNVEQSQQAVYAARKNAQETKFGDLRGSEQRNQIFKEARKMKRENQDIVGDKCVKDDDGNMAFDDKSKLAAWKSHYEKLLNVEFPWDSSTLSKEAPIQGPPIWISKEMVLKALKQMKKGKAAGPSDIMSR